MLVHDVFRWTNLKPLGETATKHGRCICSPEDMILYKKGALWRCDVCISLMQTYENPSSLKKGISRLIDSNFLLITEDVIEFFGNHRLDKLNPKIKLRPSTEYIKRRNEIIHNPPTPPWMFISFSKSEMTAADLKVTEDNKVIKFCGATDITLDRLQVLQMVEVGMSDSEWVSFLHAFADMTETAITTMQKLTEKYPLLSKIQWFPTVNSEEHKMVKSLLKEKHRGV